MRYQKIIAELAISSWEKRKEPVEEGKLKRWLFMWQLTESDELDAGDVVIADLFPTEFWEKVPPPKPEKKNSLPKDPTNMFNACVYMIKRYLRPANEQDIKLVVITYVPHYMERDLKVKAAGEKLREVLNAEDFLVFEKEEHRDMECFQRAVDWATEALRR